jgi:hypothetical protein
MLHALLDDHTLEPYSAPAQVCPGCGEKLPRTAFKPFQLSDAHGEWWVLRHASCGWSGKEAASGWDSLPGRERPR